MGISNIAVPNKNNKICGDFGIYVLQNRHRYGEML